MDKAMLEKKYEISDQLKNEGNKYVAELMMNAKLLSAKGKGIVASDQSNGTCG